MSHILHQLEGNPYDVDNSNSIEQSEFEALLQENITQESRISALEAAIDFAQDFLSSDVSRETSPKIEQQTVQFLATKVLRLRGETVADGSIDGVIGANSLRDIQNASGIELVGGVVTLNTISKLLQDGSVLVTEKRNELEAQVQAQETEQLSQRALLAQYESIDDINVLVRGSQDAKDVQSALNALGFSVGTVDGIVGPRTRAGFSSFQEQQRNEQQEALNINRLANAEEQVRLSEALLREVQSQDLVGDIASIESNIATLNARIASHMNERDLLHLLPDVTAREEMQLETTEVINRLLDRKAELEEALINTENAVSISEQNLEEARGNLYMTQQEITNIEVVNDYASKSIEQMSRNERRALQRDINAIRAGLDIGPIGVDGAVGPQTRGALVDLGYSDVQENYTELKQQALEARNTRQLEISQEEVSNNPHVTTIDETLSRISMRTPPEEIKNAMDILMHHVELATDGEEGGLAQDMSERRIISQYITAKSATMVDEGLITALQASQITESLLSTQCYPEGGPTREQISRMLGTISILRELTRDERGVEIPATLDNQTALNAILRSEKSLDMGQVLQAGEFPNGFDIDLSENIYIVTGDGLQTLPIRDTAAFQIRKWELVGNTIVGLMDNGCNGNVVYIPLDYTPPTPGVVTPGPTPQSRSPDPQPVTPETEPTPETARRCRLVDKCEGGYIWKRQYCWDAGTWGRNGTYGPWERTNETCGGGGGGGGGNDTGPSTSPGDESGSIGDGNDGSTGDTGGGASGESSGGAGVLG